MILSGGIFIITYIMIILEKLDRTVIALSGAVLMVVAGIITQKDAFEYIDYNTLVLLISMMIIVMLTRRTGVFEYLAIKTVKITRGEPWKLLVILSLITGILSALLDNVTTILLILPITLNIAKDLHTNPVPFIISEVFASNVGGTATLIGDPPNIMISSASGFTFMDFIKNDALIIVPILFLTTYIFLLVYRKKLKTSQEAKLKLLSMDEKEALKDIVLLKKCTAVLALTILGFVFHGLLNFESSTIALAGAVILLIITGIHPEKILKEVEWKTILFFAGLFVLVGGIKASGIINLLARGVIDISGGNTVLMTLAILWVAAIASAFIDNIPFVATMIPLIQDVGVMTGINVNPLWWALSLGACLGGNGTTIGASANVIATGIADEFGHKITFIRYFKVAFPLMILTISICSVYLLVFYLI
ncbi:MAG: ArsB/NhaD family transporter [Bacillota bacterium]|nr:ArsB/NhaD family transporter [Bacillota bacterium]